MCRGAGLLPRFSKRLLFLCEPPGRFGVTLKLLRQGLDLPEDQQAFFFQRGDLLFQRIAAALIIRERQRGVLFNRRVFTGAAQRTGLTRLEPVAVAFRVFNRFFPLAERLQVEIVLVLSLYCSRRSVRVALSFTCSACACWTLSAFWRRRLRSS